MSSRVRVVQAATAAGVASCVLLILLAPLHPEAGLLRWVGRFAPGGSIDPMSPAWWLLEALGNVALFVPVGAVLALLLPPVRSLLVGVLLSAACELAQEWIPMRHASAVDVILNTIGTAVGVATVLLVQRRSSARRRQAIATNPHSVQAQ
jgi:glycopeptide antibiotics resistance protein